MALQSPRDERPLVVWSRLSSTSPAAAYMSGSDMTWDTSFSISSPLLDRETLPGHQRQSTSILLGDGGAAGSLLLAETPADGQALSHPPVVFHMCQHGQLIAG